VKQASFVVVLCCCSVTVDLCAVVEWPLKDSLLKQVVGAICRLQPPLWNRSQLCPPQLPPKKLRQCLPL
jgi:hypothetical protein